MASEDESGETIPALEEMHGDRPGGPWDDAELVIYSADTEWAQEEPTHKSLEELDLVSFSLWARWDDQGVEVPILAEASWHIWYSLSADSFAPDEAEPVSDAFVRAIVEMVDEDVGEGWGDVTEDTWEDVRDVEKYILHLTQQGFLTMEGAEPALVIDWCEKRHGQGDDHGE